LTAEFLVISCEDETTWLQVVRRTLAPLGELEVTTEGLAYEVAARMPCKVIIVDASETV